MRRLTLPGRLVVLGLGTIGQGLLPLILRHIEFAPGQCTVLTADDRGTEFATSYGIEVRIEPVNVHNYERILTSLLRSEDFLLNVSFDVSSVALIDWCQRNGICYLDTNVEPWAGGYIDPALKPVERTNYAFRQSALDLRNRYPSGPTALIAHGANPGFVSFLVKEALVQVARDMDKLPSRLSSQEDWARLAQTLGVRVIQISERDSQVSHLRKNSDEFVNTWSVDAFTNEARQPAELGWGTHERQLPRDSRQFPCGFQGAIYLMRSGATTQVRGWTPGGGPYHGFLITHNESISIADYYTLYVKGLARYRPTVYYAYHPCNDAIVSLHELVGRNWHPHRRERILMDDIVDGCNELGIFLMGPEFGAYWYGSRLSIEKTRELAPKNNATSLQVAASVLAGLAWVIENRRMGILEPDQIYNEHFSGIARPYFGEMVGSYSDWVAQAWRDSLFPTEVEGPCLWQFQNFRVT